MITSQAQNKKLVSLTESSIKQKLTLYFLFFSMPRAPFCRLFVFSRRFRPPSGRVSDRRACVCVRWLDKKLSAPSLSLTFFCGPLMDPGQRNNT